MKKNRSVAHESPLGVYKGHHTGNGIQAGSECPEEVAEDWGIQETSRGGPGGKVQRWHSGQ